MNNYQFSVHDDVSDPDERYELNGSVWPPKRVDYIIGECGEHYNDHCDGWEDSWPLKIFVYQGDKFLGSGECSKDHSYDFSCSTFIDDKEPENV